MKGLCSLAASLKLPATRQLSGIRLNLCQFARTADLGDECPFRGVEWRCRSGLRF